MYTLYDKKTGQITGRTNDSEVAKLRSSIPGSFDSSKYYIKNGVPITLPEKPSRQSWHVYKMNNGVWNLNLELTTKKALEFRRYLLSTYVDKVNPIWLSQMNAVQQLQVANYRQDLLDITDQPNFPVDIIWPNVPDILK